MSAELTPAALARLPRPAVAVFVLVAAAWTAYFAVFGGTTAPASGVGAGLGAAAFLLGIRHGFDADHIAAIDNVTRRLTATGRASAAVGLWFALGHSTIVFAGAVLLGAGARFVLAEDTAFGAFTSVWGPAFSGVFIITIAVLNARSMIRMRRSDPARSVGDAAHARSRRLGRIRGITRPWQMYPVGLLFGLGFDTATSVALLVTASLAASADPALLAGSVICLPLLFAAGMSLVDTADSALMARAYSWSRRNPAAGIRYDVIVTGATLVVGVGVGMLQLTSAVGAAQGASAGVFAAVEQIDSSVLGTIAIATVLGAAAVGWAMRSRRPA